MPTTLKSTKAESRYLQIADDYAKLRRVLDPLQERLNQMATLLKEESGLTEIRGKDYLIRIQKQTRHQVPQPIILREMGQKWYNGHCTNTEFKVLNFVDGV